MTVGRPTAEDLARDGAADLAACALAQEAEAVDSLAILARYALPCWIRRALAAEAVLVAARAYLAARTAEGFNTTLNALREAVTACPEGLSPAREPEAVSPCPCCQDDLPSEGD